MIISANIFVSAHLITILFHLILAIMIFLFASEKYAPSYNQTCACILFIVSLMALSPIIGRQAKYQIQ